jgi:hypothetical protein
VFAWALGLFSQQATAAMVMSPVFTRALVLDFIEFELVFIFYGHFRERLSLWIRGCSFGN